MILVSILSFCTASFTGLVWAGQSSPQAVERCSDADPAGSPAPTAAAHLVSVGVASIPPPAEVSWAVIAPQAWLSELDPLIAHRGEEFSAAGYALEQILAEQSGADAPERLKRWLYHRWKNHGLRYALLVGDADTLPVRFMMLDRKTEAAFDTAFYPSDHYYADVARADGSFDDWNAQQDGFHQNYFGEVHGEKHKSPPINLDRISYQPEVAMGRWPVSEKSEVRDLVAKTLAWELRPERPAQALFVHAPEWIDARAQVGKLADAWVEQGWQIERQFYGTQSAPSPQTVLTSLLQGQAMVVHVGHGNTDSWHKCLGPKQRDALATTAPGIFMSIGCSTAHFCNEPPYQPYLDRDGVLHAGTGSGESFTSPPPPPASLQPGRLNSSGLGEKLMRMPGGGAVGYIGCTTGAQPCALTLLDGFALHVAAHPQTRLGDAWSAALSYYWRTEKLAELQPSASWYPASIFFQGMKFMVFGDPALTMPAGTSPAKQSSGEAVKRSSE
jgi:peptidase C25-like protein